MQDAKKVFSFFEEISRIPRSSGDEKAVSDYLMAFAEQRGLEAVRDHYNNVIIKKPATMEKTACAPVILQGHTDMVYVRAENCTRAYEEGIGLIYKDGWLYADGTTLGADNGVAVAYMLALLDSDKLVHPDIEAVFTVSEEVGLIGAEHLDYTALKGKYLLNIDTEEEGVFYTSCAGAFRNELRIPVTRLETKGLTELAVHISGLVGGHSGMEIGQGRANALQLMARLLTELEGAAYLSSLGAEGKTNAICNNAEAHLRVSQEALDGLEAQIQAAAAAFSAEYEGKDTIIVKTARGETGAARCYDDASFKKAVAVLMLTPCGVQRMSRDIPGLVETSANLAYVEETEDALIIVSSARSSVGSRKTEMRAIYDALATLATGTCLCSSDYPQWEHRKDSPLRELAMACYEQLLCKKAETRAIHAGLECGYFDVNLNQVDIISFGPDIFDVHTPKEKVDVASMERMWHFTQALLQRLAEQGA